MAGISAVVLGLYALSSIDPQLTELFLPASISLTAAGPLYLIASRRRQRRALGFDPDFYLAVERRVSEQDRRPELLVHRPTKQPEYSGWYAYASEQDECSGDLVAWSMKDLVDHSPETARPLRQGNGKWKWDEAHRLYRRVEHRSEDLQPA